MAGVRRFQDLDSHKLAVQVRREVLRLTRRASVRRDYRYLHQIRDAARSAPRNIAEGFGLFNPAEILRFLSYATGSLCEVIDNIEDGVDSNHFTKEEGAVVLSLARRTLGAISRWRQYLHSPRARQFYADHKSRSREQPPRARTQNPKNP
jgi:four helix bundle protein